MQKRDGIYKQYKPNLSLADGQIPTVELGSSFCYLGRLFCFDNSEEETKSQLLIKLQNLLGITDQLKIKAHTKIKILKLYIKSLLSFELKAYNLSVTWIEQNLDSIAFKFIRKWMELPVSANLKELYSIPRNKCGLGWSSFKHLTEKLRLIKRNTMMKSSDSEIRQLVKETENSNINSDSLLTSHQNLRSATKKLVQSQQEESWFHLNSLSIQGASISMITEEIDKKDIELWSTTNRKMFYHNI